jgi:hypothetical protein
MIVNNTTDLPDKLIAIAVAFSIQAGVEIDRITVKNKAEGVIAGQWGWYFPTTREIVLIVPRKVMHYRSKQKYSHKMCSVKSRAEFLVRVMAHELRHAYQFQVGKMWMGMTRYDRVMRELDAESYEEQKVHEWRVKFDDLNQLAASRR